MPLAAFSSELAVGAGLRMLRRPTHKGQGQGVALFVETLQLTANCIRAPWNDEFSACDATP